MLAERSGIYLADWKIWPAHVTIDVDFEAIISNKWRSTNTSVKRLKCSSFYFPQKNGNLIIFANDWFFHNKIGSPDRSSIISRTPSLGTMFLIHLLTSTFLKIEVRPSENAKIKVNTFLRLSLINFRNDFSSVKPVIRDETLEAPKKASSIHLFWKDSWSKFIPE